MHREMSPTRWHANPLGQGGTCAPGCSCSRDVLLRSAQLLKLVILQKLPVCDQTQWIGMNWRHSLFGLSTHYIQPCCLLLSHSGEAWCFPAPTGLMLRPCCGCMRMLLKTCEVKPCEANSWLKTWMHLCLGKCLGKSLNWFSMNSSVKREW